MNNSVRVGFLGLLGTNDHKLGDLKSRNFSASSHSLEKAGRAAPALMAQGRIQVIDAAVELPRA